MASSYSEIYETRAKTKAEAHAKLKAHADSMEKDGKSPYFGKIEGGKIAPKGLKKVKPNGDPWDTHPSDAKAHRKGE